MGVAGWRFLFRSWFGNCSFFFFVKGGGFSLVRFLFFSEGCFVANGKERKNVILYLSSPLPPLLFYPQSPLPLIPCPQSSRNLHIHKTKQNKLHTDIEKR